MDIRHNILFIVIISILGLGSCVHPNDAPSEPVSSKLEAPSHIWFEAVTDQILKLAWRYTSEENVDSFSIYVDDTKVGSASKDAREFIITSGLITGNIYNIGISSESNTPDVLGSDIASCRYVSCKKADIPSCEIESVATTLASFAFSIRPRNVLDPDNTSFGVCWCEEGLTPTKEDSYLYGPSLPESGTVLQLVPATKHIGGVKYTARPFIENNTGVYYGNEVKMCRTEEPSPISFDWEKVDSDEIPAQIEVYSTKSTLNGRKFSAWYAICDLQNSDIELRTNIPNSLTTIDDQSSSFYGDCFVLVNGGYFASGDHTGIAINDYIVSGSINNALGSLNASEKENSERYPTTRGIFGVDDAGHPAAMWASGSTPIYFSSPVPSIKGEKKYPMTTKDWKSAEIVEWSPRTAISAGPLLLKDGKVLFDFSTTPRGDNYYYSNYEFIADDIFGEKVICDRTAIGCTPDGKTVLFICDGRITSSPGANLLELALIMKGLGCSEALNLDGGGSTGMVVGGKHYGDLTGGNRKVKSTVGFFRRK